jgi:hypothetical protein
MARVSEAVPTRDIESSDGFRTMAVVMVSGTGTSRFSVMVYDTERGVFRHWNFVFAWPP